MERELNSVGKMCFVKYFEQFSNLQITFSELAELLQEENGYSIKACRTRVSKARKIIANGQTCLALKTIISAQRIDEETRAKATELYYLNCN